MSNLQISKPWFNVIDFKQFKLANKQINVRQRDWKTGKSESERDRERECEVNNIWGYEFLH